MCPGRPSLRRTLTCGKEVRRCLAVSKSGDTGSAAGYLIDHTAYVYAVDPDSRIRALYPPGLKPGQLAGDFAFLKAPR